MAAPTLLHGELYMTPETGPTADVYAGDMANADRTDGCAAAAYMFAVRAEAEPSAFARVANVFNIANVAPRSAQLRRELGGDLVIAVVIDLTGDSTAEMIRRKLEQLTCVTEVTVKSDAQ
jgi:hypothetical protein